MNQAIRVLFVEDVRTDAELEVRELRRAGLKVEHRLVETETDQQAQLLRLLRCDQIQGYLISRPLSPQDAAARMAAERQAA